MLAPAPGKSTLGVGGLISTRRNRRLPLDGTVALIVCTSPVVPSTVSLGVTVLQFRNSLELWTTSPGGFAETTRR